MGRLIFMRLLVVLFFTLISAGCALKPEPAPLLSMPKKPSLQSQRFQVEYQTEHAAPKVKSVQLPAHAVSKNQTVVIVADKTSVTDTLYTQLTEALTAKQLKVVAEGAQADYTLSIHQLDLELIEDTEYQLVTPEKPLPLFDEVAKQFPVQQCATILGQVSMRLTHRKTGDVVWFAKSSIDSASFHREPLIYSFEQQQLIKNELEVASFVHEQNSQQARMARVNQEVTIPAYQTITRVNEFKKEQGPCNRTEISALTPMMQYYLSSILIDKIKVQ